MPHGFHQWSVFTTAYNAGDNLPSTGIDIWPAVVIGLLFLIAGCLGALWSATR